MNRFAAIGLGSFGTRRIVRDFLAHLGNGKWTFSSRQQIFLCWAGAPHQDRLGTTCTAGCELALHIWDFVEVTASVFWHPATAVSCARTGLVATAL